MTCVDFTLTETDTHGDDEGEAHTVMTNEWEGLRGEVNNVCESEGPGGGARLWGGVAATILREKGEGNHTGTGSAGCHGSNG